jgi:hypothetical protein
MRFVFFRSGRLLNFLPYNVCVATIVCHHCHVLPMSYLKQSSCIIYVIALFLFSELTNEF